MQRLNASDFLEQVLAGGPLDLPLELRKRLLKIAQLAPSGRVHELERAYEEAARG